ncbi:MAG TPA: hypothetical protein VER11_15645 [Polyangiaceae bacterium]|nr:hypothetical protein [Polyangiaceae bacterium]
MGATLRSCVRAAVLAAMTSAVVSSLLPGCQFPEYRMANAGGGPAGSAGMDVTGGTSGETGGTATDAGEGGSEAGAAAAAGTAGAAGMAEPPVPCEQECIARAPAGWQGPMALWEGSGSSTVPGCPPGYADPTDLHSELIAPDGACTCTCSAEGQVCDAELRIFDDLACTHACANVPTTLTCAAVSGCVGSQGSVSVDSVTISGGTCVSKVSDIPPPTWKYNERLCQTNDSGSCDDPGKVCAPTPRVPYGAQLCVKRDVFVGQDPPPCPTAYSHPFKSLHSEYMDHRECSPCTCGSVSGGSCSGSFSMSSKNACAADFTFGVDDDCPKFNLGQGTVHPTSIKNNLTVHPGSCGVATPSKPSGEAIESGTVTIVCCQ